jgi:hypothetical protein
VRSAVLLVKKDEVQFHRTRVDAIAVGGSLSRSTFVY